MQPIKAIETGVIKEIFPFLKINVLENIKITRDNKGKNKNAVKGKTYKL